MTLQFETLAVVFPSSPLSMVLMVSINIIKIKVPNIFKIALFVLQQIKQLSMIHFMMI